MKPICFLFMILSTASAADPPVRLPDPPSQQIQPAPKPNPSATQLLAPGQYYVIDSDKPLLVEPFALTEGAAVTVTIKKGTITLPAELTIGRKPDADDPSFCTITGPNIYIVKAAIDPVTGKAKGGNVLLDIVPTTNKMGTDKDGKPIPIPFTAMDITRRTLTVVGPRPPPDVIDDPVLTAFQTKLRTAIRAEAATPQAVSVYAALFRNAAKITVMDEGVATSSALLAEMQRAVKNLGLPAGSLDKTARVVADELNTLVPKTNIVLDKPTRDSIATVFTRIATDLEAAK